MTHLLPLQTAQRLSRQRDAPVITAPVYARDNYQSSRTYARPALRKVFAAFPADTKVA
jgi:hypothetical protein